MNIGGYGQGLSRVALAALSQQGQRENERVRLNAALNRQQQAAQGEAAGVLTGAATRAAAGLYQQREADFNQRHADEQHAYDTGSEGYKATHTRPDYSALDDIAAAFDGVF